MTLSAVVSTKYTRPHRPRHVSRAALSCFSQKRCGLAANPQTVEVGEMILNQLGIFGWKEPDENLILASHLTGDLLPLIGPFGP